MKKDKYGFIYKITNKINGKIYIGQSINGFSKRYNGNLLNKTHNNHLKNSISKYGIDNFIIDEEFAIAYSKEELDNLEIELIKKFNSTNPSYGYNKKSGGANGKPTEETIQNLRDSHAGYIMPEIQKKKIGDSLRGEKSYMYGVPKSEEVKIKISNTLKGRKIPREIVDIIRLKKIGVPLTNQARENISKGLKEYYKHNEHHCKGKILSEEHRKNISKSRKGIVFSEEHKKNLSNARKGKLQSEEHRKNISKALKGRVHSEEHKKKISKALSLSVICVTTNKVFKSIKEASDYYNITKSAICNCCKGKQKIAGQLEDGTKLQWLYYEDYLKGITIPKCKDSRVICITTGEVFSSAVEGAKHYGIGKNGIYRACRGVSNTSGKLEDGTGLVWKWYSEYIEECKRSA